MRPSAQLDARLAQRPQRPGQEVGGYVAVDEQRLGVAHAPGRWVLALMTIASASSTSAPASTNTWQLRRGVDDGDRRHVLERGLQALAAAGHDQVDQPLLGGQLGHLLAPPARRNPIAPSGRPAPDAASVASRPGRRWSARPATSRAGRSRCPTSQPAPCSRWSRWAAPRRRPRPPRAGRAPCARRAHGRRKPSMTSPTGSWSATIARTPSAIAATRAASAILSQAAGKLVDAASMLAVASRISSRRRRSCRSRAARSPSSRCGCASAREARLAARQTSATGRTVGGHVHRLRDPLRPLGPSRAQVGQRRQPGLDLPGGPPGTGAG